MKRVMAVVTLVAAIGWVGVASAEEKIAGKSRSLEDLQSQQKEVAADAELIHQTLLDKQVVVETRGGELNVRWDGTGKPVWMTGGAVTVYEGTIEI